jgi:serine/threonine protein kinase
MSSGAMDLLERMLVFDPSKRITGNLAVSVILLDCKMKNLTM